MSRSPSSHLDSADANAPSYRSQRSHHTPERPKSYQRAPGEKRDRLAAAAEALFADQGYARTTTAEIAARAGVSEGILFHHFKSKRELFAQVAARYARGLVDAMLGSDPGDLLKTPGKAIRNAFAFTRENPSVHRVFAVRDPELADLVHSESRNQVVATLEKTLRAGMEQGLFRPMNPRIVAELCHALVDGALQTCFLERGGEDEEQYAEEAIACVTGALRPLHAKSEADPRENQKTTRSRSPR
jgi:AcrR family transcriptional regulator